MNRKKFNKVFWVVFCTPFALLALLLLLAAVGALGYMPSVEVLENPEINLASQVISEDGKILGSFYYKNQNRTFVDYNELPQHLVDALIATEDIRFYRHPGIDAKGLARVAFKTVLLQQRSSGGGSTITQQLAKLLFHEPPGTKIGRIKQKLKEWIIAVRLERAYTKEEIITMYFNQYDYLNQAVGIKSASYIYFNTIPDSLKFEEAALLVGMAKNPYLYNPVDSVKAISTKRRRNIVLNQMKKYGYIDEQTGDSLKELSMELDFRRISHTEGLATYYREFLRKTMMAKEPKRKNFRDYASYQLDSLEWADNPLYGWCNKNKKPDGKAYNLYTDGLRIYVPIDTRIQQYAEEAVAEHLGTFLQPAFFAEKKGKKTAPFSPDLTSKQIQDILWRAIRVSDRGRYLLNSGVTVDSIYRAFKTPVPMKVFSWHGDIDTVMTPLDSIRYYKHLMQTGFMAMEPQSGHVKAYVGGIDFNHLKYDHVTQGRRQPGSTFKPFLYILAMQEGFNPCDEVPNSQVIFYDNDSVYSPKSNSRPEDLNQMKTLKWGLATSENNISAFLVSRFKPKPIADIAHKMGITSYIDPVPSMIYGTSDISVAEMVSSYATFANKGEHTKPVYVIRIEDKNGNVLTEFKPERVESINEKTAFLMLDLMQGVADFGTAIRLRYRYNFTAQIAAKTGTTQNHSDGWFIGITPKLVAGCWVGAEDRSVHFDEMSMGQGATMALPIWAIFMQKVYADTTLNISQEDTFEVPADMPSIQNCEEYAEKSTDGLYYWENEW
ncbi:MAG: transglycosylase domain-containing protein [Bacteroidales bacterium]|nr:transglycosylase domain-containing protein [Bacteroidales bacterium]MBN2763174.1 transglycosylase domain-containing protein [Bacteroidales bacterium]